MQPPPVKRIVLADDHNVVRHSLKFFLETQSDLRVVAEASDGIEALKMVERHKPDILLIDLFMPVLNGLDALRELKKSGLLTRAIILSMHASEAYVMEALKSGAAAYVLKQSTADNLIHAIREVVAGRRYLSPPLSERAIEAYVQRSLEGNSTKQRAALTVRESEILDLVGQGHTSNEIGRRLSISARTVEHHRASLMRKLKCRHQADLIREALALTTANSP
jgi:two-component system, NarL family, response regulator NreC